MEVQCPFQITWDKTQPNPNFADYFFTRIQMRYGKRLALINGETGKQWRYSDLLPWAYQCQHALRAVGASSTSRIGFLTLNVPEIVIGQLATAMMGVVAVMINPTLATDEIWYQIDLSEVNYIVTQPMFVSKVEEIKKKAAVRGGVRLKQILLLENLVNPPPRPQQGVENELTKIQKNFAVAARRRSIASSMGQPNGFPMSAGIDLKITNEVEEDENEEPMSNNTNVMSKSLSMASPNIQTSSSGAFLIYFSSGVTGLPKPIEVSHKSFIINMQQMSMDHFAPPTGKDRFLLQLRMHHLNGGLVSFFALFNGCTAITISRYSHDNFLKSVQDFKITYAHVFPTTVNMLAKDEIVDNYEISSIKTITCAGAPLDPAMAEMCVKRLELKDLRQSYGMTETCGAVSWSFMGCPNRATIGMPLPGMLFKVSEGGQTKGPHEVGELLIKGPQVTPTMFKNLRSTKELFDNDGYLKTGDLAYYDEEGYFYVVDRIKDVLRYKGTIMSPSEVENLLRTIPGVEDCAVIGRSEQGSSEAPAAFVVKAANCLSLSSAEIRSQTQGKIPIYKELRGGLFFTGEIPRSISGKIIRKQLKAQWERERVAPGGSGSGTTTPVKESPSKSTPKGSPNTGSRNNLSLQKNKRSSSNVNLSKSPSASKIK